MHRSGYYNSLFLCR